MRRGRNETAGRGKASAPRVASGHLFFFYAYDVGFYIAPEKARELCEATEVAELAGLRPSPSHVQYNPKPLGVPFGPVAVKVGDRTFRMEGSAEIFDFGALSVTLAFPLKDVSWIEFVSTALLIAGDRGLAETARALALRLFERIRPAVSRASFSDLVEDYNVWHVGEFSPYVSGDDVISRLPQDIASLLTLEQGRFSPGALAEILKSPIRYFDNDLVLPDWNAAFVYDRKYQDTVEVLEFLNVQLLELRFFDRTLHAALDVSWEDLQRRTGWAGFVRDPFGATIRRLSEIRTDVCALRERITSALKLVGDTYLARVYEEARTAFGTRQWEQTIRDQLDSLEDVYTILNNRASGRRLEILEWIIVVLIVVEIALALFGLL